MLFRCLIAVGLAFGAGHAARGQLAYPQKPVQVIVGFSAGGSVDVMARNLVAALSAQLGQPFLIVNKDGASGAIGFGQLANAAPDGYTLGAGPTTPISIAPHLTKSVKFGVDIPAIPYRGEASMFADLVAGRIPMGSPSVTLAVGQKVRVLAVFADSRHPAFPDAPTFSEIGMPSMPPGFNGLFAPKGTPREILATLERACEKAVQTEAFRTIAQRLSQRVAYLNGAAFAERAAADYKYKGEVIRALYIKVE